MNLPNFFIVGAPKSGTTALYTYLSEHPNVFLSTPKEPEYFADDLPNYRLVETESRYRRLFKDCSHNHIARGEASTGYLFSSVAIKRIGELYPDARIIAMLRNPVDMAYAWHSQAILNGDESEQDFERAWDLQEQRKRGDVLPARCRHKELLLYKDWAMYSSQVQRLFDAFPRQQVRVIIFDDFIRDTRQVYEEVLTLLNVPTDGRDSFPRINENQVMRAKSIGNYIENPPRSVRYVSGIVKDLLGVNSLGLFGALNNLNRKKAKRLELPPALRARICSEFREDVQRLSELLGRDLTYWTGN